MALIDDIQDATNRRYAILVALQDGATQDVIDLLDQYSKLLNAWVADHTALTTSQLASLTTAQELTAIAKLAGVDSVVLTALEGVLTKTQVILAEQIALSGLPASTLTADLGALEAFVTLRTRQVAARITTPLVETVQTVWVESTFTGTPLPEAIDNAVDLLKTKVPSVARTEIGTAVSSIDRAITASTKSPDTVYLYIGPSDRVTRKSCATIVGKWGTYAQIQALHNGQLANVLITGGGYNCRHSWAPMHIAIAKAQGILQITTADIRAFNASGARKKKKKKK